MLLRFAGKLFFVGVIILIVNIHSCFASGDNYVINYLTADHGLSQNEVTSILQDHTGFMWFGTRGGLNRYDGKNFIQFNSDPGEKNLLSNPSVERIFQTRDKVIWIGSKSGGLSSYDPVHGVFKNYYNTDRTYSDKCWGQRVISFFEDESNHLWIGTWSDGLFTYENNQTGFQHMLGNQQVGSVIQTRDKRIWAGTSNGLYVYSTKDRNFFPVPWEIKKNHIVSMVEDPLEPVIWIVGWGLGLVRFDYIKGTARQFIPEIGQSGSSSSYSVIMDSSRQIWMGTWGAGLYKFNQANSTFEKIKIKPASQIDQNIDYGVILDLYFDKQGILWIGTDGGGVCQLVRKQPFSSFTYSDGLLNTHVLCIGKDAQNTLWIGTRGGGLYYKKDGQSIRALQDDITKNKLILSLFQGSDGTFWVGQDYGASIVSYRNGHYKLLAAGEKFGTRDFDPLRKVLGFLEDDNSLWMGTQENGLYIFEKTGNSYRRKHHFLPSPEKKGALKNDRISSIFKDSDNNIWVGTYHGLYLYSRPDSSFIPLEKLLVSKSTLASNIILYVKQDLKKNIWIATPNGLNELTCIGNRRYKVKNYRVKDGLADNYVHAILVDSLNNLWVSTYGGISKFDNFQEKFINYGITDGLPGRTFSEAAAYRSGDTFYFGGINGVTSFNPLRINESKRIPEIRFTSLSIFNHDVRIGGTINNRVVLPVSLDQVKDLQFSYRDREVTFGFAALNYISSDKNRYAYKLEGYNTQWVSLGNRNFVSFNNLKSGSYVLKVKGSNNNNVWNNDGISLNFTVLPPPWKTWYAYVVYVLLIAGFAFLIWSATFKRLQLEQKIEIEKMRAEQEEELNKLKIDFFTSISHEIRTPLTLIFAPLQELMVKFSGTDNQKIFHKLNLISLNARKLMSLINQLLDFRKVESNQMEIKVSKRVINETIESICFPYLDLANSQSKKFVTEFSNQEKELWYDGNMMEVILNNLLSNAFKFCPEDGTIRVHVYEDGVHLVIDVIDNGQGIPSDELDKIFNRFYQSKMNDAGGTGIGLFLVKKYVELHKGSVEVQCVPNATTFRLKFLKGSEHFTPDQIEQSLHASSPDREIENIAPVVRTTSPDKNLSHKILIIDDNKELRDYLEEMFGETYIILTADNGIDGYHLIISENPDLVISDITMPKLDGLELCKRVKNNDQLKHVPFLLLTARNAEKYILLGTKYGADDYITKPFNYLILKHKVDNLISTHVRLQNKYSQKLVLEPSQVEISNSEEKLLKKVVDIIEKNISNPDFNPGFLASQVNMSQSSLYRRLHTVTHQTVNELIREIRIKRSAQFLADKEKSISEIAYEVGFNDVKYFRKSFQKQFGKSPSEYRDDMLNKCLNH